MDWLQEVERFMQQTDQILNGKVTVLGNRLPGLVERVEILEDWREKENSLRQAMLKAAWALVWAIAVAAIGVITEDIVMVHLGR
jgi:hypothetical protein